jgi:hypothetical protein
MHPALLPARGLRSGTIWTLAQRAGASSTKMAYAQSGLIQINAPSAALPSSRVNDARLEAGRLWTYCR